MTERLHELAWTADSVAARVRLRGSPVLSSPLLNRGTVFTLPDQETLGLTGLLPRPAQRSRGSSRGSTGSTCMTATEDRGRSRLPRRLRAGTALLDRVDCAAICQSHHRG